MSIKVRKRTYNNPFTDQPTDWLLGNTGDLQKLNLEVAIAVEDEFSQDNKLMFEYPNKIKKLSGKPWKQNGFDVGDTIGLQFDILTNDVFSSQFTRTTWVITEINDNEMLIDTSGDFPVGANTLPAEYFTTAGDNIKWVNSRMYADKRPEALDFTYNHLENAQADSHNLSSFIDGNETKFLAEGLDTSAPNVWQFMEALGYQSGMGINEVKIRYLGDSAADNNYGFYSLTSPYNGELSTLITGGIFNSYRNFHGESLPITVTGATSGDIQSQNRDFVGMTSSFIGGVREYASVNQNQCFINNALSNFTTDILINFAAILNNTNDNSNSDQIRLVLLEFTGAGATKNYLSKTIINAWDNADSLVGDVLSYTDVYSLNVVSGRSYSIVLEWYHLAQPLVQRNIQYTVNVANIVLQEAGSGGNNTAGLKPYEYLYEIEVDYMISSLFEDITSFGPPLVPPNILFDANSLTDNFLINAYPEYNNPNLIISNDLDFTKQQGNTGWYGENFNESPNDFTVESVNYTDLAGNPVNQLDYTNPTKAIIRVSGIQNLGPNSEVGFGFAWIPTDEEDYKNKTRPFHKNVFASTGGPFNSFLVGQNYPFTYQGFGYDSIFMSTENPTFTEDNGDLIAEITFRPTAAFAQLFEDKEEGDRNYILWLSVADSTLETNESNRVSLLCDFDEMELNIPPAGPYEDITNTFLEHPEPETEAGEIVYDGFLEDDVLCKLPFRIDISQNVIFNKMTFGVQVRNVNTGEVFELQNYPVDLTGFITDTSGVQQLDFDNTRGFKMLPGFNKNWVKIERDEFGDVGNSKKYNAYYAFKIRWEDWLSRANVPAAFYDNTQLNDGFNNDWLHYLSQAGYQIDFFTLIDVNRNGLLQQHKNIWPFVFSDYDQNSLVSTEIKTYRQSDNADITQPPIAGIPQGVFLENDLTRIEIDYIRTDLTTWDLATTYAVTTLEIVNGAGQFEHRQLSSVIESEIDNPLRPLPGQTKLSLSLHNGGQTLRATCLVDPGLLEQVLRYKITGRVGCLKTPIVIPAGLYEDLYEDLYE